MKSLLSHAAFLTCVLLLWSGISAGSAQEAPQASAKDTRPLEKASAQIKQINDDYKKQVDIFVAAVDAERDAKRIGDTIAQLLRALAAPARANLAELSHTVARIKNEPLRAALIELEAAVRLVELRAGATASEVLEETRKGIGEAPFGDFKQEDIVTLENTFKETQGILTERSLTVGKLQVSPADFINFLQAVRLIAAAEKDPSPQASAAAATNFRNLPNSLRLLPHDETMSILRRQLERMRKAVQDQGVAIQAMIAAHQPVNEIFAAIERFGGGIKEFNQLTRLIPEDGALFPDNAAHYYSELAKALDFLQKGNLEQANRCLDQVIVNEGQQSRPSSSRGKSGVSNGAWYNPKQVATNLQKEVWKKVADLREQTKTEIISGMGAVKQPSDIDVLVAKITDRGPQLHASDGSVSGSQLASQISQLVNPLVEIKRGWDEGKFQRVVGISGTGAGPSAPFERDFMALRNRILQKLFASNLKAPELNSAPYVDQAPEAAIEAFCDDLAKRGEWKRLLEILQLRAPSTPEGSQSKDTDGSEAIRSYLLGKNSELAEQWVDAVLAYKSVLKSTASRAPIQAAADALKVIAKAHPEAIAQAATKEEAESKISKDKPNTGK